MNELREEYRYTWADLLALPEDTRAELIDGEIFMMSAPSWRHQEICGELFFRLRTYLEGKRCKAIYAPLDVRLFAQEGDGPEDVDTVVQPDVFVVCDPEKLDDSGCRGAPDMVIEVLSPSSARQDRYVKYLLYQRAGVKEYWIVDPENQTVAVHLLEDGIFGSPMIYTRSAVVPVESLDDCRIDLGEIF